MEDEKKIEITKKTRLLNLFSQNRDKEQKRIYFRNLLNWKNKKKHSEVSSLK